MTRVYTSPVPKSLFNVSEDREDLYDQAYTSNWKNSSAALAKISGDNATLQKTERPLGKRSNGAAALTVAVKRDIAAKDRPVALRDINQMTHLTIEMGADYAAPIPVVFHNEHWRRFVFLQAASAPSACSVLLGVPAFCRPCPRAATVIESQLLQVASSGQVAH